MYSNKKVLVVGVARSGIGAANLLCKLGAEVIINDIKSAEALSDQLGFLDKKVSAVLGIKPDSLIKDVDLIVVSPGIPTNLPFFAEAKENHVRVISEIELAYTVCKGKIAAITGTNGKTTTAALVGAIFEKSGGDTFIVGNIGEAFSNEVLDMKENSLIALEVSSFQMETIETFTPKVSALLNITEDHLVRHGTMEEYIRCKKRIFENQTEDDYLIINYDDDITRKMASEGKCKKVFFSKKDIDGDCVCIIDNKIVIKHNGNMEIMCAVGKITLPGIHNLENVLAAVAITYFYGISIDAIKYSIQNFKAVEHRLEFVGEYNQIRYINDSKGTNIDATMWAVKAMDRPTIIILGGYDKGAEFEKLINEFSEYIIGAVVIGETKDKITASMSKNSFLNYKTADTLEQAVYTAIDMADEGYNILLSPACASYDMFKDFEARGAKFKEIVGGLKE